MIEEILPVATKQLSKTVIETSHQYAMTDAMINALCKNLVNADNNKSKAIYFSEITTATDFKKIIALRLKLYEQSNPYLLDALQNGTDDLESRSVVYAAWIDHEIVATIRLTPHPYETTQFIAAEKLAQFLGENYQHQYLEWSRLLVDPNARNLRVMPALLVYAGMKVLTSTQYTQYFGFTKPIVRKLMRKFSIENESLSFTIPERENNSYLLLKGNFSTDFWNLSRKGFSFE